MSKKTPMKIHMRKISSLKEASYNPRKLSDKQYENIKESLTRFDMVVPIVVNQHTKRKNIIVGGHQRVRVARDIGIEELECVYVNLTEAKERELNIRLNQNTGEFDEDKLKDEFEMGELMDFGFGVDDLTFFEDEEKEGRQDPPPEEPPSAPKSVAGNIYKLGKHRLMCGDSTSMAEIEKLLGSDKIDIIYTDPPYGISINQSGRKIGKAKKFSPILNDESTKVAMSAIDNIFSLMVDSILIWGGNYFTDRLPAVPSWIIWDKQGGKHVKFADCEMAWTNTMKPARIFQHIWDGFRRETERSIKKVHPTQKPVKLCEECIAEMGGGMNVLDLFGGSGSTLIACENIKRNCYMMELDPGYCDVIIIRYCQMVGIDPETVFNG